MKFEFDSTNAAPITRTHDCAEERFLTVPSKRRRPTSGSARATEKSALFHDARHTPPDVGDGGKTGEEVRGDGARDGLDGAAYRFRNDSARFHEVV